MIELRPVVRHGNSTPVFNQRVFDWAFGNTPFDAFHVSRDMNRAVRVSELTKATTGVYGQANLARFLGSNVTLLLGQPFARDSVGIFDALENVGQVEN